MTGDSSFGPIASSPSDELWLAIYELHVLLTEGENAEEKYQKFFERRPVVFRCLGFDKHQSFEKSSKNRLPHDDEREFRPEPDFLCYSSASGTLTVFELKTPFMKKMVVRRSNKSRTKLREEMATYMSQCNEYVGSIRENSDARSVVAEVLGINRIASYEVVLVAGRSVDHDPVEITRLTTEYKTPIRVLHYDQALKKLIDTYRVGRPTVESRPGWSFYFTLVLPSTQVRDRAYIADYGQVSSDRVSLLVESEDVVFSILDSNGREHRLAARASTMVPVVLHCEFSTDAEGLYMSLSVDNRERVLRVEEVPLILDLDPSKMIIGSDADGVNHARFQWISHYVCTKTKTIEEKLELSQYLQEQAAECVGITEFDGNQSMARLADGRLVQEDISKQPIYRDRWGYGDAPDSSPT